MPNTRNVDNINLNSTSVSSSQGCDITDDEDNSNDEIMSDFEETDADISTFINPFTQFEIQQRNQSNLSLIKLQVNQKDCSNLNLKENSTLSRGYNGLTLTQSNELQRGRNDVSLTQPDTQLRMDCDIIFKDLNTQQKKTQEEHMEALKKLYKVIEQLDAAVISSISNNSKSENNSKNVSRDSSFSRKKSTQKRNYSDLVFKRSNIQSRNENKDNELSFGCSRKLRSLPKSQYFFSRFQSNYDSDNSQKGSQDRTNKVFMGRYSVDKTEYSLTQKEISYYSPNLSNQMENCQENSQAEEINIKLLQLPKEEIPMLPLSPDRIPYFNLQIIKRQCFNEKIDKIGRQLRYVHEKKLDNETQIEIQSDSNETFYNPRPPKEEGPCGQPIIEDEELEEYYKKRLEWYLNKKKKKPLPSEISEEIRFHSKNGVIQFTPYSNHSTVFDIVDSYYLTPSKKVKYLHFSKNDGVETDEIIKGKDELINKWLNDSFNASGTINLQNESIEFNSTQIIQDNLMDKGKDNISEGSDKFIPSCIKDISINESVNDYSLLEIKIIPSSIKEISINEDVNKYSLLEIRPEFNNSNIIDESNINSNPIQDERDQTNLNSINTQTQSEANRNCNINEDGEELGLYQILTNNNECVNKEKSNSQLNTHSNNIQFDEIVNNTNNNLFKNINNEIQLINTQITNDIEELNGNCNYELDLDFVTQITLSDEELFYHQDSDDTISLSSQNKEVNNISETQNSISNLYSMNNIQPSHFPDGYWLEENLKKVKEVLKKSRCILHIDLDCFYAQVEHKRTGISTDVPLAVQQWNGLLAINYAARKYGINRMETPEQAKSKCPNIKLIHVPTYNAFDKDWSYNENVNYSTHKASLAPYRNASKEIFDILSSFTDLVQKGGTDEAFLDVTNIVNERIINDCKLTKNFSIQPLSINDWKGMGHVIGLEENDNNNQNSQLINEDMINKVFNDDYYARYWKNRQLLAGAKIAARIRATINSKLGFTCGAGISHNKHMAKLCSTERKPNQQTILLEEFTLQFLKDFPITKIRFMVGKVGHLVAEKFGTTCGSLWKYKLKEFQKELGKKNGNFVFDICRGINHKPVKKMEPIQTIMSGKSLIPPVTDFETLNKWLEILSTEIVYRLEDSIEDQRWPKSLLILLFCPDSIKGYTQVIIPIPSMINVTSNPNIVYTTVVNACSNLAGIFPCKFISLSAIGLKDSAAKNNHFITDYFQSINNLPQVRNNNFNLNPKQGTYKENNIETITNEGNGQTETVGKSPPVQKNNLKCSSQINSNNHLISKHNSPPSDLYNNRINKNNFQPDVGLIPSCSRALYNNQPDVNSKFLQSDPSNSTITNNNGQYNSRKNDAEVFWCTKCEIHISNYNKQQHYDYHVALGLQDKFNWENEKYPLTQRNINNEMVNNKEDINVQYKEIHKKRGRPKKILFGSFPKANNNVIPFVKESIRSRHGSNENNQNPKSKSNPNNSAIVIFNSSDEENQR